MTESENENDHFDLDHFDQMASLLTLGIAFASIALPSLNRSLDHFDHFGKMILIIYNLKMRISAKISK